MSSHRIGLAVLIVTSGSIFAAGPDESFLAKIPSSANAILYIDVAAAYTSPLGRKEEWAKRYSQTQHASLNSLPPTVEQALIAAQYDLGHMDPVWRLGFMKTDWLVTLADIAAKAQSAMESIAGRSCVYLPQGAYITAFDNNRLATYFPANRQAFARWVDSLNERALTGPSPFLRNAVTQSQGSTLVMAVELKHALHEASLLSLLSRSPNFKNDRQAASGLAKLFAGINGFTFTAAISDRIQGRLRIDFAGSVKGLEQYLPNAIDDLLGAGGMIVDDFVDWKPNFDNNSMTLEGRLSSVNLHRLLSLFELPGNVGYRQLGDKSDAPDEKVAMAAETRRYFNALSELLQELRNVKIRDTRTTLEDKYKRYAFWYESYADKIEQLNTRNVDPELAEFGSQLVYQLRGIIASLRGVPAKIDALGQTAYSRNWFWWSVDSNVGAVANQQGEVLMKDIQAREDAWKKIDDRMTELKTKLSAKYRMPF